MSDTRVKCEALPALTGLRFLLALWVILHHLTGHGDMAEAQALTLPAPLYALVRGGYQAVTTFFVLSGFVLMRNYEQTEWNRSSSWRYGLARFARIYPIYVLSFLAVAPFIREGWEPGQGRLLAAHLGLVQGWIWPMPVNWNTPAWSLSCEAFFYLLFPLGAIAMRGAGWKRTTVAAVIAICLTRAMWRVGVPDEVKPLVHFADFLMGIAAARAFALVSGVKWGSVLVWLGVALGALVIAFPDSIPFGLDMNTMLRPLNAALLVGLALGSGWLARGLSTRAVLYLGKASYALYILHVPVLWWYARMVKAQSAIVYIAIVLAVSALVYSLIEEPANRYLRGRFQRAF